MNSDISQQWCLGRWVERPGKHRAGAVSWKPETEGFTEDRRSSMPDAARRLALRRMGT